MHRVNITVDLIKSERDVEIAVSGLVMINASPRLEVHQLQPYLVTTSNYVKMISETHAAELAYAMLLKDEGEIYITVAGDHSDKEAEKCSLIAGEHMYPKIIARRAWRLRDIESRWRDIEFRSWAEVGGSKKLIEELRGSEFPGPRDALNVVKDVMNDLRNIVIVVKPMVNQVPVTSTYNEIGIHDPVSGKSINHYYWVE